ncbi:MBL fold metallo-hydrolase [Proteiniclasticum ruminis]|uniref:MBL fold metallo-hydrolase n=1 Tax=Proteiniclasticum ruminis TaxID=398199 RepID=UPI0028B1BF38|nr:MBL fold metallo-hydrolase [Proteiniclasticum ruminis]
MKVTVLLENDLERQDLKNAHGLSFYIETEEKKVLFDFGPDDSFMRNAEKLGIDLKEVDLAVLSHGHQDHGGGLSEFLHYNKKAKVYIQEEAFLPHYSKRENGEMNPLGIEETLKHHPQVVLLQGDHVISEKLQLLSVVDRKDMLPPGNETLYMEKGGKILPDDFQHEQHLVVREGEKTYLFFGCGHQGILNILSTMEDKANCKTDAVFGGFHIKKPSKVHPDPLYVEYLARRLSEKEVKYFTCHCTGRKMYAKLQETLKKDIDYVRTGRVVEI